MADASQIQQMLANLQNQLATVSSLTGQLGNSPPPITAWTPPINNPQDIAAIVKATLVTELQKLGPTQQAPVQNAPQQPSAPTPALFSAAPQLAAPTPPPAPIPQPVPQLAAPVQAPATNVQQPTQQSMQDVMMKDFLNQLKLAIGGALSVEQQQWVSGNLFGMPDYFRSPDGKEAVSAVLTKYYQYVESHPK